MNDVRLVPFEPAHLDIFDMRETERAAFLDDASGREKLLGLLSAGMSGCVIYDGRILALMGYIELWPGVVEVYIFPSVYVTKYAKVYLKTMKIYLRNITENFKWRRVQTCSIADDTTDRFMRFFGFEPEGLLRQYSPDKMDYRQWSIIIPE